MMTTTPDPRETVSAAALEADRRSYERRLREQHAAEERHRQGKPVAPSAALPPLTDSQLIPHLENLARDPEQLLAVRRAARELAARARWVPVSR